MMTSERPPKRPSDELESPAVDNGSPSSSKTKFPRLDRAPEDFSSVVKTKLSSYSRTGQACDRCKVRKIRCDALPEGCSHCVNQSLECYVTDRVTGRTERRGYLQELEREKIDMLNHIRELEKILQSHDVQVAPWQWSAYGPLYPPGILIDSLGNPINGPAAKDQWIRQGSVWTKAKPSQRPLEDAWIGSFDLQTRPADSHLGVIADSAPLSSIKGTQLSILGTTIDMTSFDAPDMDEPPPGAKTNSPLYNKSVQAFLNSTMGVNLPLNVALPDREEAFTYAEWYFLVIVPFVPVLHKPSFMKLLSRTFDDSSFKPSTEELVILHMVYAIIFFQYGVRNRERSERRTQLNELSNRHYHWCLSKFYDLASAQTVTSVQALTLIAMHTRSFPKPGCATLVASFAFDKAIALNLHRAMRQPGEGTNLENEMRKRVWWSILTVIVTLHGRLGRPMPITLSEFDVDFPVPVPEECLTDEGITDPSRIGNSPYTIGYTGWKILPIYIEMWSNIYSVRRDPKKYVETVRKLDEKHKEWQRSLPDSLRVETCKPGTQMFALYTRAYSLELDLCLHHPSVCLTKDPDFCAENSRICEKTAKDLLDVADNFLKLKSLDTTWYQMSVYVAAIFTILMAHWERRFNSTSVEVAELKKDVDKGLNVITEIGHLLGSGARLSNDISVVVQRTISWIERDMGGGNVTNRTSKQDTLGPSPRLPPLHLVQDGPASHGVDANDGGGTHHGVLTSDGPYYSGAVSTPSTPYPPPYSEHSVGSIENGGNGAMAGYGPAESNTQYLYAAGVNGALSSDQEAANPLVAFATQATQHVTTTQANSAHDWIRPIAGGNTWHDWAAAMADGHDRYSANALLTLGSAQRSAETAGQPGGGIDGVPGIMPNGREGQWPMLVFGPDGPTAPN